VNKSWLCGEGRLTYQALASMPRLLRPLLRREGTETHAEVDWEEALAAADQGLRAAHAEGRPVALAALGSTSATNEAMLLFKHYVSVTFTAPLLDCRFGQGGPPGRRARRHAVAATGQAFQHARRSAAGFW
jgi:predicted molibdopterin-dependent oxidoreductase YjgC